MQKEEQMDWMFTDKILQDPVRAAIYHRGWLDRSVDFQRSQELAKQQEQSVESVDDQHFSDVVNSEPNVLEAQPNCQSAGSDDQHFSKTPKPDPVNLLSKPTTVVKQRARLRKHFIK